jgi:hypothetical protein
LDQAGSISHVNEKEAAEVSDFMRPAVEGYLLPGMLGSERAAWMRSLWESHGRVKDTLGPQAQGLDVPQPPWLRV